MPHTPTRHFDVLDDNFNDDRSMTCASCHQVFKNAVSYISPIDGLERCAPCATKRSQKTNRKNLRLPSSAHAGRDTARRGFNLNQGELL